MDRNKTKNIALIAALVIAIFVAYSFLTGDEDKGGALVSDSAVSAENESAIVQEFLSLLRTLDNLRLDTKIFQDDAFENLRDESIELVGQPRGRVNPFAPLQ